MPLYYSSYEPAIGKRPLLYFDFPQGLALAVIEKARKNHYHHCSDQKGKVAMK
jgi:hypothetical protein